MQIRELRELQMDFEKVRGSIKSEYGDLFKLRKQFIKDYTVTNIRCLEKDDYVIGKSSKESFCYRVENELNAWGDIHGSYADKFGIYYGTYGKKEEKKYRIGKKSFGTSIEDAFFNVKSAIIELIENKSDFETLKKNLISPMFKGKILSLYHPDEFLNIFSAGHLNYFINALGLENNSRSELDKQNKLLVFKKTDPVMKHWSIFEFSKFLYHSFGAPDKNFTDAKLPQELKGIHLKDFPPIEDVKFDFVTLQTDKNLSGNSTTKKRSQKIDYTAQSKNFKRIGDRGEQIVVMAERQSLIEAGREDLAKKVDQISKRDDSVGYDIISYDEDGKKKYIEVKSTLRPIGRSDIYISVNELAIAKNKDNYFFYVVYNVGNSDPKIWKIRGGIFLNDKNIETNAILYKITFNTV